MSLFQTAPRLVRIECDKPTCDAVLRAPHGDVYPHGAEVDQLLSDNGWQVWVSRSRRYYCPDHRPGSNTKMRRVQ